VNFFNILILSSATKILIQLYENVAIKFEKSALQSSMQFHLISQVYRLLQSQNLPAVTIASLVFCYGNGYDRHKNEKQERKRGQSIVRNEVYEWITVYIYGRPIVNVQIAYTEKA